MAEAKRLRFEKTKESKYKWECLEGKIIPRHPELKCRPVSTTSGNLPGRGRIYNSYRECFSSCGGDITPSVISSSIMNFLPPSDIANINLLLGPRESEIEELLREGEEKLLGEVKGESKEKLLREVKGESKEKLLRESEIKEKPLRKSNIIPPSLVPSSIWSIRHKYQNQIRNMVSNIINESKERKEGKEEVMHLRRRLQPLVNQLVNLIKSRTTQPNDIVPIWENLGPLIMASNYDAADLITAVMERGWKVPSYEHKKFWRSIYPEDVVEKIYETPFLRENLLKIIDLPYVCYGKNLIKLLAVDLRAGRYNWDIRDLILQRLPEFPLEEYLKEIEDAKKQSSPENFTYLDSLDRLIDVILYNFKNMPSLAGVNKEIFTKLKKEDSVFMNLLMNQRRSPQEEKEIEDLEKLIMESMEEP